MKKPVPAILWVAISVAAGLFLVMPQWAQSPAPQPKEAALREQGKQIFVSQCAKCHDADAAKKLPDGTTLLARLAANKDPKARLATRLKNMSEQDGRGVVVYMEELIARFRTAQKTPPADR
jgi:mono/diheme cytochrome c family protein